MTVADNYAPAVFTGNDYTTVFPFSFVVYDKGHLLVYERVIATGVRTLISAANYTVSGVPGAGSITYEPGGSPLVSTKQLEILREVPYTQDLDIENQGGFFANTLEEQLDLTTMQIQQIAHANDSYIDLADAVEAAEAAKVAVEAAAAGLGLTAITANTMLVDNAAGTLREAKAFADVRLSLTVPPYVADRTALKALDETKDVRAFLGESGRSGFFKAVLTSSLSAAEQAATTADTAEGIYVTSGSYTWVREEFTGKNFHVGWFHDWATADIETACDVAVAVMHALETRAVASVNTFAARKLMLPAGDWTKSGSTTITQGGVHLTSDGATNLLCTGAGAAFAFQHPSYLDGQQLAHIKVTNLNFVRSSAVDGNDYYLRFYICRHVEVTGNKFDGGTVHVQFDAAYEPVSVHHNVFWHNDAAKTNAYSIRIRVLEVNPGAAGAIVDADDGKSYLYSSMVWITENEMRALASTDVESHIYCEDTDGIHISNNHMLNGDKQIAFKPIIRGLGRITNARVFNNFFDGGVDTTHNLILESLSGTAPLVVHIAIYDNKINEASTYNVHMAQFVDEFEFYNNTLDLCSGVHMLRVAGGGKGTCSIKSNRFRLSASKSPSIAPIQVLATSLNIFKITEIIDNTFCEDESGATFPAQAVLLTGNPTNTGTVILGANRYDIGFAAFLTDSSGANWTVTPLTNTGYAS